MADVVQILNTVRANASDIYQDRIPLATRTNLAGIATTMSKYQSTMNEFLSLVVNKIAMTIVTSKTITNPLAKLKSGKVPMGKDIEELFVNPAIQQEYKMDSQDLLKVNLPDVKALYYTLNRRGKYAVTISKVTLLQAMTSDSGMTTLINNIVNSLYSGDNYDEFIMMKQVMASAVTAGKITQSVLPYNPDTMTAENSKDLLKKIKNDSVMMTFPSNAYNAYKTVKPDTDTTGKDVTTFTPTADQLLIIDASIYNNMNIDVLSGVFNLEKADLTGNIIPVDDFGGAPMMALLCDKAWWKVYDNYKSIESMFNPDTLNYHYWLHHHQTYAYSSFANAVAYTYTPTP